MKIINRLFSVFILLAAISLHAEPAKSRPIQLNGWSMLPTFKYGTVLQEYFVPYDQIKEGDVVAYHNPLFQSNVLTWRNSTAHRAVKKVEKIVNGKKEIWWVMKGDNNSSLDPGYMTPHNYEGLVLAYN